MKRPNLNETSPNPNLPNHGILETKPTKDIYLAGGCFWGTEHYFKQIEGVAITEVGFANGHTENPTYKEVYTDQTGFTETVFVKSQACLNSSEREQARPKVKKEMNPKCRNNYAKEEKWNAF